MERDWRELLVMPLIVGIMLVPVGIFSGEAPGRPFSSPSSICLHRRTHSFRKCCFSPGLIHYM